MDFIINLQPLEKTLIYNLLEILELLNPKN
jgi:hypothetical protein